MELMTTISSWNYPLAMAAWKLGPCIACGNTSVLKPAEQTPLSILYFANMIAKAGFPPGVINIVNGYGKEAGAAIVEHPDVDKIAFTGSTSTGQAIMRIAANTMKKITLETGGKSPMIIFEDADLKNAIKWAHYGAMGNMGQLCTATSRMFVHENIYERFLKAFVDYVQKTSVVGDPFEETSWHGPQVSKDHYTKILGYAQSALDEGAKIIAGGRMARNRPGDRGYYIEPTVVVDVTASMKVYREEIFGPFVVVSKFSSEDEVIKASNATDYGLAAAIFTNNITRGVRVSQCLQAGNIWINSNNNSDYRVPFGGMKQSGIGRELGEAGLEAYSTIKAVHLNLSFANPDIDI
jgi:aldehyde dehydrogenase (NAD+)